ncbi:hypothetical protein QVD17_14957 [Tagetes erecta]|uniref:Senescence regulator S40 n=1 Tax=Tagetes erecta TaxID=13708 RepID=A0AAD8NZ95_TARER|nr:hypothetical protein QVD17_14957 [Tagetes erecta]
MAASRNYLYFSGENERSTATNLAFEFNEFDVFNVASSPELHQTITSSLISNKSSPVTEIRREVRRNTFSLPVDVPDWSMILKENRKVNNNDVDDFDYDLYGDDDDDNDLIPPHEYLAKGRIASFSVHEGIGRTLKGRDLSRVRNAIWKKIGFED